MVTGRADDKNFMKLGVSSDKNPGTIDDFGRTKVSLNLWHTVIMTYDGRDIIRLGKPELAVYVDNMKQTGGNANDDIGNSLCNFI